MSDLFRSGYCRVGRFLSAAFFALCLVAVDHFSHGLNFFRSGLSVALLPIEYVAHLPANIGHWIFDHSRSQKQLLAENANLKVQALLLKGQLHLQSAIKKENNQLHKLLKSRAELSGRVEVARLLAVNSEPFSQQIILDRGVKSGVYSGQPVFDAYGVIGQIVEVGPVSSRVDLITSTRSSVPVVVERNGWRSMVVADEDSNQLRLAYADKSADILVGDVLISSGLGERYPAGYPVGIVTAINKKTGGAFADILVKPVAKLYQSQLVLLLWPHASVKKHVKKKI